MDENEQKPPETSGGEELISEKVTSESKDSNLVEDSAEENVVEEKIEAPSKVEEEKVSPEQIEGSEEAVQEEIDQENAEDAEDEENEKRHHIPMPDYHAMTMENLVGELQRLVKNEKVQAINKHVNGIKSEFDLKFQEFLELKGLVNVEEDINTTYKSFKDIQERWRTSGPIPRNNYNDVWRTYHHHIEIFYDFLHLNRELRDLDFKHNLEEKLKLVVKAEALADEPDLNKAFRELQTLHKVWKEDIGPVSKEQREEIWERFSKATKVMHARRQEHYATLDASYEKNLEKKNEIIAAIVAVTEKVTNDHHGLQQQIKEIEALRDSFFKAGKVPQKVNEQTWTRFKDSVRAFNRNKNNFYKNLKKDQHDNLEKKRALLNLAVALKDSEDHEMATPEMKRIQSEWKKIGHVPRKYSDKIWNEFKDACNHYFDKLHKERNASQKEEYANFEKKNACLERLKTFQLVGDKEKDLPKIKEFIAEWKSYGRIPYNKKHINGKFNKIIDALFKKLDISRQEAELLKYGDKIKQLANSDNDRAISNERVFIRRKIDESKNELRQLETNLQFFSNASEDSPVVQNVVKDINRHKEALETWKNKLKNLNVMENKLQKEAEAATNEESSNEEE